ncbi:hypothetical protein [Streptosporangium saharense]|uniref:hypothetical protein n=1 Tax=Streptosporangium saharense TaxID=1706840 RepID=UPI00331A6520
MSVTAVVGSVAAVVLVALVALGALVWTVPVRGVPPRPAGPWPVQRYTLGAAVSGGGVEIRKVKSTWPQVEEWAVARSRSEGVEEVYVLRGRVAWIWEDGRQIRKVTRARGDVTAGVVRPLDDVGWDKRA